MYIDLLSSTGLLGGWKLQTELTPFEHSYDTHNEIMNERL